MMFELPSQVQYVLKQLNNAGFEAYLVGGSVRDMLMGLPPKDFDIASSALPEQTKHVFSNDRVIETGLKHGTVTIIHDEMPFEITTFRVDGTYSDFRHPDSVNFSSQLKDDLARRDFTVNAMAYHPDIGYIDYFGGQADLKERVIRCVGDPIIRFNEDALRILRAIRFSSVLGFSINQKTKDAIFSEKLLLEHVSVERIYSEFLQLLCGKNVRTVIEDYIDVIGVFIPQALSMKDCSQNCKYHIYDVLRHTACTVEAIPSDPILRLAAFFHDIGKPFCRTTDASGIDHFYGHNTHSAQIAADVLNKLHADSKTLQLVYTLVLHHDTPIIETEKSVKRAMNKLTSDVFFQMLALKQADTLAHASMCHTRLKSLEQLAIIAENILAKQECFSLKQLAVNGYDLIDAGVTNGKQIGDALQLLLDAVIDGAVNNDKDSLLAYYEAHK